MLISATQGVRDEIASRLNEAETDNTDTYTNWINLCYNDVEFTFPDAPFLQTSADRTLSSGTRVYTHLPSNFSKMNMVTYLAGNTKLEFVSPEELDIIKVSATDGGSPTIYTLKGALNNARIEYFPVPGSAITLHFDYQKQITTVSLASAAGDLPLRHYELPILYGEMMGLRRQGKRDLALTVQEQYERLKSRMIDDLKTQVIQMRRIKSVREFQAANRSFDDPVTNVYWGNRNL